MNAGDGLREPFKRSSFVGRVDQARGHVAAVGAVDFHQGIVALVEFKQTPFGGCRIQVAPCARESSAEQPCGDEQVQSLDKKLSC